MDRFRRAKLIAAFRAVIRHRKVSWPTASVPPEGPGSGFTRVEICTPGRLSRGVNPLAPVRGYPRSSFPSSVRGDQNSRSC
jgi:hypothetical protein